MSSSNVAWTRLVRYIAKGDEKVQYGEPILPESATDTDITELVDRGLLEVYVCEGNSALSARPTKQKEVVGKLLGPLTPAEVPIIRCIGLNYKSHILETGRPLPATPTIFIKPAPCVADTGEDIPIPFLAQEQCDYEGELTILIGRDAKNVSSADALDYVAGYTAGNDVSARDWQRDPAKAGPIPQWSFSKSFDKYAPLGPCLVSQALLGEANNLELETIVNGESRQKSNTADLCFNVRKLVEFCSQGQTLQKGSLIMTGTPGGVGLFMKPQNFLKDGDVVTVKIGAIGSVTNKMRFVTAIA